MDNPVEKVENSLTAGPSVVLGSIPAGALGIFAKEPLPGKVKTRLCPPLSPAEAAEIQQLCLRQTVIALAPLHPVIFYCGSVDYFSQTFPGMTLLPQCAGDLGVRMAQALRTLHEHAGARVALVGSDAPDLPLPLIGAAFAALLGADTVTIPAKDGGYVLIGEQGHHPSLFSGLPWSTDRLLIRTREICAAQRLRYAEVGGWEDVDHVDDLTRLVRRSPGLEVSRYAAGLLQRYGVAG